MRHRIILAILSGLLASSCTLVPKADIPVEDKSAFVEPLTVKAPPIRPLKMNKIEWSVVSSSNLDAFLSEVTDSDGSFVFYAITVPDYVGLSLNMDEIRRYIKQQKDTINYYETLLER